MPQAIQIETQSEQQGLAHLGAQRATGRPRRELALHNFRQLVSGWERQQANFLGMLQLACLVILAKHL